MSTKALIAGILGGIVYFLLGWLLYGMLLESTFESMSGSAQGVSRGMEMVMWALIIGQLTLGIMLAYIFSSWSGISTFMGGLKGGAIIGFLMTLGIDMTMFATTNISTLNGALLDVVVMTVNSGLAGGVVGWWLGKK